MAQQMSFDEARNILKKCREDQTRDSDMIVSIWEEVLMDCCYKMGDEAWLVYEQVCTSALDCQKYDVAEHCIELLDQKFPQSLRVRRLQGMMFEALGEYDKAEEEYKNILELESTNMYARKRQIAILKAKGRIPDAIQRLNEFLKEFMTDYESWNELCDLYLAQHDYTSAAFCVEELIMSNPHNHLYHQKYAEIRYTQGGNDNFELARSYFAQAVKLNPNNLRALYGLFLSASSLAASSGKGTKDKQTNLKYATWASSQLEGRYKLQQDPDTFRETKVQEFLEKHLQGIQQTL